MDSRRLGEVASVFFKLGLISFGGPAASVALMEAETVRERRWLDEPRFLDLLAAVNLVPGPNATEMAIHLGWIRAGWPGLMVGGLAFLLPAALISLALAYAYSQMGRLPELRGLFYGVGPAVAAVIATSTYRLGRTAVHNLRGLVLAAGCLLVSQLTEVPEAVILLGAGVLEVLAREPQGWSACAAVALGTGIPWIQRFPFGDSISDRLWTLGAYFFRTGSVLFGSGMVLYALIHRDVVFRYAWLTERQLVDAIAVGQMTPGPVSSTVTFIGYLVAGVPGAAVSTAGMFLPSFLIVALTGRWLSRLQASSRARAFLSGVNAAVIALMVSVAATLVRSVVVDIPTAAILGLALIALLRYKVASTWVVVGGAVAGLASSLVY